MPALFLSHSGPDKAAAIDLKRRLLASPDAQTAGLQVWLDVDDLDEGKPWQPQLETAIGAASTFAVIVGTNGIRNWVRAETDLALSRAIKDESFRIIPILQDGGSEHLTPFVKRYHAIRDPLNNPDSLQRLLRAALGLDKDGLPVLTEAPFPGLRSMSEDWADRFFGRRTETDEVLAMLRRHRAVTIVADSGAGKSSLAMAGVGHAWRGGALRTDRPRADDPTIWHVVTMRPAENPIEQLRDAIEVAAKQLSNDQAAISRYREKLTTDPAFAIRCGLHPAATTTLLIIDQAEELVTLTSRNRRREFGRLITALADAMGDRLRILITLRSDHLNLVSGVEGLRPMVRSPEAQFNLKQPVDLAEIVRGPLTLAGHRDEEEQKTLIGLLRNDLSDRSGHLALAQMTLSLAWRDRGKHGGLLGAYAANGGARAALGNEAERIEGLLSQADTARLMPIFIRLIRLSEIDTGATRRIAAREEFDDDQNRLIDQLAGEEFGRLVQTSAANVEIAHEALITQWSRLHDCLFKNAGDLRNLSDLMRRAQDWAAAGESVKHLTSLADEERFQALRQAHGNWLASVEHRFLDWSNGEHRRIVRKHSEDAKAIADAIAEREHAINRGKNAIFLGLLGTVGLLVIVLGLGWFAYNQNRNANSNALLAAQWRADALSLLAFSRLENDPAEALKLAIASWPVDQTSSFPSRPSVFNTISRSIRGMLPSLRLPIEGTTTCLNFSPDGASLLTVEETGMARIWSRDNGTILSSVDLKDTESLLGCFIIDIRQNIIFINESGLLISWDGLSQETLKTQVLPNGSQVTSTSISVNGQFLAIGSDDGYLVLVNMETDEQKIFRVATNMTSVSAVAFSPTGSRLAAAAERQVFVLPIKSVDGMFQLDGETTTNIISLSFLNSEERLATTSLDAQQIWRVDQRRLFQDRPNSPLSKTLFDASGRIAIHVLGNGSIQTFDTETGNTLLNAETVVGVLPVRVVFSSSGLSLASESVDGIRVFDLRLGSIVESLTVSAGTVVSAIANSPDGSMTAVGSSRGRILIYDHRSKEWAEFPTENRDQKISAMTFSEDSKTLAIGYSNRVLRTVKLDSKVSAYLSLGEVADDFDFASGIMAIQYSDDGVIIEVLSGEGQILRVPNGKKDGEVGITTWRGVNILDEDEIATAFSPAGPRYVSNEDLRHYYLRDAASEEIQLSVRREMDSRKVTSLAFSPDSSRFALGFSDGTVSFYDSVTGTALIHNVLVSDDAVRAIDFSADSLTLVVDGGDGDIRFVGSPPPGNILQVACRYLPHINGRPDTLTDGLAAEIGIKGLTLPKDCDTYDPPLPPEFKQ